jgi:hypothetical protein
MAKFKEELWTVVQHSGYGYAEDPQFRKGLETRQITTLTEKKSVIKAGGLLFGNYADAEQYCMEEMYPDDYGGIIPVAPGIFSAIAIDQLLVYIPKDKETNHANTQVTP